MRSKKRYPFNLLPILLPVLALLLAAGPARAYEPMNNPVGADSWWWDAGWWEHGRIAGVESHPVRGEDIEYAGASGVQVPALLARPDDDRRYPAVLFMHGRRGLDDLVRLQVGRIAARGFVVLAPDLYAAHFIEKFPITYDEVVESDLSQGLDTLLARPDVSSRRACLASHTRGGYSTLRVAVTLQRQRDAVACYVAWYPHLQHPEAPEPEQVYRYAGEFDQLEVPTLIFIGEQEQYQRRRSIETAVTAARAAGRDITLVIYPGVGRGFDFRPPAVRTFADDLAARDALLRAARFMGRHLEPEQR